MQTCRRLANLDAIVRRLERDVKGLLERELNAPKTEILATKTDSDAAATTESMTPSADPPSRVVVDLDTLFLGDNCPCCDR